MVYIGIDLGTTYSCVSVIEDGRPVVIVSDDGKPIIPSVVAYCDTEILVGNPALTSNTDISNVLYDSKRLIGAFLPDKESFLPFSVETRDGVVGYVLNAGQPNERFLRSEEVSAEILKKLKTFAERYLPEKEVTEAVVTVPAFFNNDQIDATKRAIKMAGLDLKYLLEEPTAAAIAYYSRMRTTDSTIMVFDWGGGTLDISIAEIKNEKLDVKSVCGDAHLGGQDFDERIMKYVIEEFKKSNNFDISQRPKLMKRLRQVCKEAKESLSFHMESYNVNLDINDDTSVNVKISRSNFNQLCEDLFDKAMRMVEKALEIAQIDSVILVGGSTRIPKIQELLSHKFGQTKLRYNANLEEAVAHGAAIIADTLEKGIDISLINNTANELGRNINNSHNILFYFCYRNNYEDEGKICLFNSSTRSVEEIAKFHNYYVPYRVATTQNQIFGISGRNKSFEIFDLNTRQISRGPNLPEWRKWASVAYFKNKLYYLGGKGHKTKKDTNRVDVLIDGKWQTGPAFPLPISSVQTIACDEVLYVIGGHESTNIYRLSDDEREWIEIGEIPERRSYCGVALLNGRIYITGGWSGINALESCLCFDLSAPSDSRISRIADMSYTRYYHSLVAANGKLFAIGGFQNTKKRSDGLHWPINFCNSIEEYDPQTNTWREVGILENLPAISESVGKKTHTNRTNEGSCLLS